MGAIAITSSLSEYYKNKYPEPKSDSMAIQQLVAVHKELFGAAKTTMSVSEGIAEQFRLIKERDLPAYEWLMEAMHVTSKKEESKKNFPYIVGMIRQWLKNGFGHIPIPEEDEVVDYFEEIIGCNVTSEARQIIKSLMGRFGAVKVTRMIGSLETNRNVSQIKAKLLQLLVEEKYNIMDTDLKE